jgi:hypothetical protein
MGTGSPAWIAAWRAGSIVLPAWIAFPMTIVPISPPASAGALNGATNGDNA